MKTTQWTADIQNVPKMRDYFHQYLSQLGYSEDSINKICLSIEEVVVNIISYGFPDDVKEDITIEVWQKDGNLTIEVIDSGLPFNPLESKDPDVNAPLEQRDIGGLGIFFVKQLTDQLTYERLNDRNILTLVFRQKD